MKLRIVQHFFGDGNSSNGKERTLVPPMCEFSGGCIGRANGLYADENLKGWALCKKHEDAMHADITTCSRRSGGKVCTLPKGHSGSHQYLVDKVFQAEWPNQVPSS
jgi:hypothetical protein